MIEKNQQIGDISVAYAEQGAGEAVVLVHGLAEDQRSFAGVQAALPNFHTFAYALRGHGDTQIGEALGTLAQLGDDLIAFLETVSGPARCMGYSLGGTIVLWVAAKRPDLVSQVIVAGTSTVVGRTAVEFFEQRIDMLKHDVDAFPNALRSDTAAQLCNESVDLDAITANRLQAVGRGLGYRNAARAMIRVNSEPLTTELAKIQCPIDVIGADGDVFCPKKAAEIILQAATSASYHEIAGAGHLMSVDQPNLYASCIREILTGRSL